ncbi:MAG: tetratricopeptide repeat protein [Endomicrobia bacterium]|nr:tetratricopeptide repeat protein [Endomicrobiia bacterium]
MKKKIIFVLCFILVMQTGFAYAANYEAYRAYLKGVLAYKANAFDAARKDYEKVVALDPDALAARKELMHLYWRSGNQQKAFDAAEKIENLDGENPATTMLLANFYIGAEQPEKARKFWEKTLELEPDNEIAILCLAAYYDSDNKLEKSAEYWNEFLKNQPDSAAGYFQLGMIQEKLDMTQEALNSYDKVLELKPESLEVYLSKARIYENINNFPLAVSEYAKARDAFIKAKKELKGADNEIASYWLGVIYQKMGNIDKAAAEFEYLSSKQPDNVAVIARLGYYYSLLKQYAKAEKKLKIALSKDPLNYEISYLLGLNYIDWQKYDKAIKSFEKVVSLNPDFADAYYFMGNAMDKNGDFENAEKAFLQTLAISPEHTRAMNYLGYTYADKNIKLKEAEILLDKAVALEPQNGAYLDSLGWLYYRQEKYELAEKFIVTAANITRDAVIYEHLGDVYVELAKINDAWIAYALARDAGAQKSAKRKLELVQKKISPADFYNVNLFRAGSNYQKLFSLKTGYKMKISVKSYYSVKGYLPFNYVKGEGVSIGMPAKFFMGNATVYIKDGNATFDPKAAEDEIPQEFRGILDFASGIFSQGFFKQFENSAVDQSGKKITYASNGTEMMLDSETGLVEKITKDGIVIEPVKYKRFFNSMIPSLINVSSKQYKFKGSFEAGNIALSDKHVRDAANEE